MSIKKNKIIKIIKKNDNIMITIMINMANVLQYYVNKCKIKYMAI